MNAAERGDADPRTSRPDRAGIASGPSPAASGVFADGLELPEGPVVLADGTVYIAEMSATTGCVTRLDRAGRRTVVGRTGGRPGGLAVDGDGRIWAADSLLRAAICLDPDGTEIARITGAEHEPFLFPNDLAFGPDGHLYLTDSGLRAADFTDGQAVVADAADLPWDGRVFELDPGRRTVVRRIDRGIRFANGIAFDAAGRLHVNATLSGDVYRYDLFGAGPARRDRFGNVLQPGRRPGFRGPDGMRFGRDGRLYCAVFGEANVTVLDERGRVAERLSTRGSHPTNCAFANDDMTLLVTEAARGRVEALAVGCGGARLHVPTVLAP